MASVPETSPGQPASSPLDSDVAKHRPALLAHCYRMLGSIVDADDAVQESLLRAVRFHSTYDARASYRTWLLRIATRVCLDTLSLRTRRERPMLLGRPGTVDSPLTSRPREHWLEPVPDVELVPHDATPAELASCREQVRLAFVASLQLLPARQRAALLLVDVAGCTAVEAAAAVELSVPALNSALQRARATLEAEPRPSPRPTTEAERSLVSRFVEAFERYDVDGLAALLREDVIMSMPPYELWLRGRGAVQSWLLGRGAGCRGSRLVRTSANGVPAFGQYRVAPGGGHSAWGLCVLELADDGIGAWNTFLDVETLFPRFGLPLTLAPGAA